MRQKVRIRQFLGNRSVYSVMKGHKLVDAVALARQKVRPFSFLQQIEDSLGGFGQRKGKGENGRCCILFLSSPLSLSQPFLSRPRLLLSLHFGWRSLSLSLPQRKSNSQQRGNGRNRRREGCSLQCVSDDDDDDYKFARIHHFMQVGGRPLRKGGWVDRNIR